MSPAEAIAIRPAAWPDDAAAARSLLEDYFQSLRDDPAMPAEVRDTDRGPELETVATRYDGNASALLLAWEGTQPCGCVSLRTLTQPAQAVELKRLYVAPGTRGRGLGRSLMQTAIAWAQARGVRELLLDTLPQAMPEAVRLYLSLGFKPAAPYHESHLPGIAFYRLWLG